MKHLRLIKNNSKNSTYLLLDKKKFKCKVGKNGVGKKIREGDLITPEGVFSLKRVFFRSDKINKPKTSLNLKKIEKFDFWCVDSRSNKYNKLYLKSKKFKCESLHRHDSLYDIIIEISFNTFPIKKNKGSAIFIHCSGESSFTEGCISLKKEELLQLLKKVSPTTKLIIS